MFVSIVDNFSSWNVKVQGFELTPVLITFTYGLNTTSTQRKVEIKDLINPQCNKIRDG
jgi:hypothetical protein